MYDVWHYGRDIWMFHISCCWLIVSGQVDLLITNYLSMRYYNFGHFRLQTNNILCIHLIQLAKDDLCWIVKNIMISVACISGTDILNSFGISFPWTWVSLVYVSYDYISRIIFYAIYIFVGFNHFWILVNHLINGLGWRFPEISNMSIILCEPFMHQFT